MNAIESCIHVEYKVSTRFSFIWFLMFRLSIEVSSLVHSIKKLQDADDDKHHKQNLFLSDFLDLEDTPLPPAKW